MYESKKMFKIENDVAEFIELLVTIGNVFWVDEKKFIRNGNCYLGHKNDAPKVVTKFRILFSEPQTTDYAIFNPFRISSVLNPSVPEKSWLYLHVEKMCCLITKQLIFKILSGIRDNDQIIKEKYNGALLTFSICSDLYTETMKNINDIPANFILSLNYCKKTNTATIISQLLNQKNTGNFQSFSLETWNIFELLFEELILNNTVFKPITHEGDIEPLISQISKEFSFQSKQEFNNELNAKLHVLVALLKKLNIWSRNILGYGMDIDTLEHHLDHLEEYCKYFVYYHNQEEHDFSITDIVLTDHINNTYSLRHSYDFFINDTILPNYNDQNTINGNFNMSSPRIPTPPVSIMNNNHCLSISSREHLPDQYSIIPQTYLASVALEKNSSTNNFSTDIPGHITDILSSDYNSRKRNYYKEVQVIKYVKIFINLLMTLENSKELQKWFPGITKNGVHYSYKGYTLNLNEYLYKNPLQKQIPKYNYSPSELLTQAPEDPITLYAIVNGCRNKNNEIDLDLALSALADKFSVDENNIYNNLNVPDGSSWQQSDDKNICYIPFHTPVKSIIFKSSNGAYIYSLICIEDNGDSLFLPVTNWVKDNENPASFFLMPNIDKFPLLNLDYMRKYSHAKIIIIDDVEFAYEHGTEELADKGIIWTTWYGGDKAIKHVDWNVLKGRTVYYLCTDVESKDKRSTTLKILTEFEKFSDLFLHITGKKKSDGVKKYKHEEFIKLAKSENAYIPNKLQDKERGNINVNSERQRKKQYIVESIILKGTVSMIYAPTGIGKTWLALSIALAVANGTHVFKHWKNYSKPQGVIYFAGEMDEQDLENRIADLNKIYNKTNNETFLAKRLYGIDLGNEESQVRVDNLIDTFNHEHETKLSLLILDNLNTLAESATKPNEWNCFLKWLETKKGLTTIIVHHPNKQGIYLGTSNIANKVDMIIYAGENNDMEVKLAKLFRDEEFKVKKLLEPVISHKISMFVSPRKIRSVDKFKPFWLSLSNPEDVNIHWQINIPDYDQMLGRYGYSLQYFADLLKEEYFTNKFAPEDFMSNFKESPHSDADIIPTGKDFLNLSPEKQTEIIKDLYYSGPKGKMSGREMANILDICPRTLNIIRSKTGTLDRDLKQKN